MDTKEWEDEKVGSKSPALRKTGTNSPLTRPRISTRNGDPGVTSQDTPPATGYFFFFFVPQDVPLMS